MAAGLLPGFEVAGLFVGLFCGDLGAGEGEDLPDGFVPTTTTSGWKIPVQSLAAKYSYAAIAWASPAPEPLPAGIAVALMAVLISALVQVGKWDQIRPATPAAWGVAILVPDFIVKP